MKSLNELIGGSVARFVVVGGLATAIDFVLYIVLSNSISVITAKTVSMLTASVFSYYANKLFTFKVCEKTNLGYLTRFYIVFVLNFLANVTTNQIVFVALNNRIIAFLGATLAGMTVNYIGQKLFVFKID